MKCDTMCCVLFRGRQAAPRSGELRVGAPNERQVQLPWIRGHAAHARRDVGQRRAVSVQPNGRYVTVVLCCVVLHCVVMCCVTAAGGAVYQTYST